jgi:hypothetical protein
MYQDIAVARGSTYDTLNKRMDRYLESIYRSKKNTPTPHPQPS